MRATYQVFYAPGFVCVIDQDKGMSVTNDIEQVISDLGPYLPEGTRLLYRDTEQVWDEAVLNHVGGVPYFKCFSPLGQHSMQDAINAAIGPRVL